MNHRGQGRLEPADRVREWRVRTLIANSRGPETLSELAHKTGAIPVDISETARGMDVLVIAIPMKSVPLLPKDLLADLPSSSPIIDAGNYYPLRDGVISEIQSGMIESHWTSQVLGRAVIKAFNNIVADSLVQKMVQKARRNGSPFRYPGTMTGQGRS